MKCINCGYCKKEKRNGREYYYCNDLDFKIDNPYIQNCSDENCYS